MWMNDQTSSRTLAMQLVSPTALILLALLTLAGGLLFTGHGNHLVDILIYLPLAGCLLMHLFMHHGYHHHSDKGGRHE